MIVATGIALEGTQPVTIYEYIGRLCSFIASTGVALWSSNIPHVFIEASVIGYALFAKVTFIGDG